MSMDLKVSLISSDSDDSSSSDSITLSKLHSRLAGQGKAMVIDLWHTKCVKCPAALSHLNDEASGSSDIVFVACALSLGDGNRELVADLVSEWENLTHVFMEVDVKEAAKAAFGFTQVPYYIVIDKNGTLVGSGEPKTTDYIRLLEQSNKIVDKENVAQPQHVFTLIEDF